MTETTSSDDALSLDDLPQPADETTVPPTDLHVDGDNPNEQSDKMFELLVENMRAHGWIGNAIIANTNALPGYDGDPEGLIADGEHRWRAAQELGLDEVPVKFYDFEDDAGRRLWRQELNKISGEHDAKRDALEYDRLLDEGRADDVHDLVDAADEDLDDILDEIRVDDADPVPYEYSGDHDVYFEDCTTGLAEHVPDDSVHAVITDPPYGIGWDSNSRDKDSDFDTIEGDEDLETALELFREVCQELQRVLTDDGVLFVFSRYDVEPAFREVLASYFEFQHRLVWVKNNHGLGDLQRDFAGKHEDIIYASAGEKPKLEGRAPDVLEYDRPNPTGYEHPTQKPVPLIRRLIELTTQSGDTVLDPFMGSGTTAVAAIQAERDYVGFELDADNYRDVIERRISETKRQVDAVVNTED